jgi:RNA polymerase sigma-70 factor (ECF subfamily)
MVLSVQITEEFYANLRAFVRSRVSSPEDAEDILQDGFRKALQSAEGLRDGTRLTAWLYQILRNSIVDYYRARKPGDPYQSAIPEDDANSNAVLAACLRPFLAELPDKYRDVVQRIEFDGLTQAAYAAERGLSVSGAKSRVQRGRVLLKERLEQCCRIETDGHGNVLDYAPHKDGCSDCGCD